MIPGKKSSADWFDEGLEHKRARRWRKALECNAEAVRLDAKNEAGYWNLGIAATALGEWGEARRAWRGFGIEVPDGKGPIEMNLGVVPIRANPAEHPEVIWCRRVDPARGVVVSVPLPDCGRRHGDVLLHDGAPNGWRKLGDKEVPVFDELEVLEVSRFHTFEVKIEAELPRDQDQLLDAFVAADLGAEDWSTIRMLCKKCSEGRPYGDHEHPRWSQERRLGVAARSEKDVLAVLRPWAKEREERSFEVEELL